MATMGASSATPKRRSFRFYKWLTIIFLFCLGVINFADKTIIGFAAVPIMTDLGLSHEQFGMVGSAFFWFFSISALVVGRMSDRFSTKSLLTGMASIWAAVQFATVFIGSFGQLVATRVILGIAEGPSYNLSIHHTAKWLPQSQRGLGFSLVTIGSALGPALAAPVLIYVIYHAGWRDAFLMLGVVGIVWIAAWLWFAKDSPESVGMESPEGATAKPGERASIAWRDLMPAIFSRDFVLVALHGFTSYWGLALLIVWVPSYLEEVRQISHHQAMMYLGLPWLAGAIGSLVVCAFADRLFKKTQSSRISRVYIMGILGLVAQGLWYLFIGVPSTGFAITALVLASAASSCGYPLGSAIVSDMVLPEHRGTMLGVLMFFSTLAGLIAPAVSGHIIQSAPTLGAGYYNAFIVLIGINVVTLVLFLIGVRPPKPGETPRYVAKMQSRT